MVNPHGNCKHLSEDAVHFLDYIRTGTAEDDFTKTIDNAVLKARNHQEWRIEYMNWCAYEMDHKIEKRHAWEDGRQIGLEEGREKERKILQMNQRLLKENRFDDLKRASYDDAFRERLMAELFQEEMPSDEVLSSHAKK